MTVNSASKTRWTLTISLVFVVVFVGAALTRFWHEEPVEELPTIKVAYLPIYVDLPLFVAVDKRFFQERGINVELKPFQQSPDMGSALVGGEVDAVASIATHSALAIESRDPGRFRIFLVDAETPQNPLSSLVVGSSSSITKVDELRGRTIGSFPGPTAKIWGPLALETFGLQAGDYTMVELPIGSHISALETDRIDAVVTYEPTATQAVEKYGSRKLVPGLIEGNVIDPWQAGVWILSTDLLNDRKDDAAKFVLAIYDAVDYLRKNPDEAKSALSKFTTIDPEIASKTPNIPFTKISEVDVVTLQRHADILTAKRSLSKSIDVPSLIMPAPYDQ